MPRERGPTTTPPIPPPAIEMEGGVRTTPTQESRRYLTECNDYKRWAAAGFTALGILSLATATGLEIAARVTDDNPSKHQYSNLTKDFLFTGVGELLLGGIFKFMTTSGHGQDNARGSNLA